MLVHVANGITSGPNQRFATDLSAEIYGVGSTNRPFREPGIQYPGLAGLPVWDGNPEVFEIDPDRLGATTDPDYVPAGSTYSATGVMAYEFSGWELWPTAFSFTPADPAAPGPRPQRRRVHGRHLQPPPARPDRLRLLRPGCRSTPPTSARSSAPPTSWASRSA